MLGRTQVVTANGAPDQRVPLWLRAARALLVIGLRGLAAPNARAAEIAAAITRHLPRSLWSRYPRVIARRRGVTFEMDLRDNVQRTLYFTGWYERRYLELLLKEARRGDVYLDIGAHIGIHTLFVARRLHQLGGGFVIAFEPSADLASQISRTAARNHLTNVTVVNVALGAADGSVELHADPERFDASDAAVRSRVGPGPVVARARMTTFDAWRSRAQISRVDIVKIDVEGDELAVLQGMRDTLIRLKPRLVGVEIREYILERAGVSEAEVYVELAGAGYEPISTPDLESNFLFQPCQSILHESTQ